MAGFPAPVKNWWWSVYASVYDYLWNGELTAQLAGTVARLAEPPGVWTIDAGAGTGLVSSRLARAGHRLICVDSNAAMIRHLATRLPDATALIGSVDRIPLRCGQADVVVATNLLHLHGNPTMALDTLAGLLAPGGRLICSWPRKDAGPMCVGAAEWRAGASLAAVLARTSIRIGIGVAAGLLTDFRRVPTAALDRAVDHAAQRWRLTVGWTDLPAAAQTVVTLHRA